MRLGPRRGHKHLGASAALHDGASHATQAALRSSTLSRLGVRAPFPDGHGPVVFGYAGPEDPDHDYGEHSEEGFEEAAVDGAFGAGANVRAYDVLEDLANGEKEGGADEVVCGGGISGCGGGRGGGGEETCTLVALRRGRAALARSAG